MEYRRLGRLGHQSSVLIYGAAALSEVTQDVADRSIQEALDAGINHLDVAASYGDAELRLGPVDAADPGPGLPGHQDRATATARRPGRQINTSLERLQTDRVDLLQLHAVGDLGELDMVTGARRRAGGGDARAGRGPRRRRRHHRARRRAPRPRTWRRCAGYPFATVLTPLNPVLWRDAAFRADYEALVDEVRRQDAGLMTIKTVSRRNWPEGAGARRTPPGTSRSTTPSASAPRCRGCSSHDEVTGLATSGDVRLLGMIVEAERDRCRPPTPRPLLERDPEYSSPFLHMTI